ncbi:Peptidase aspartic [Moelleriella libera RCEF 2490]|uniref:Peptidase aspartic n=1 Tax=Moelleriella libera RCEF 2490 TaxID=1081109 RepID=A0A168DFW0_9HYPO|nr:Peptidase aspartic [Moelleriella libera RCEF 2490]
MFPSARHAIDILVVTGGGRYYIKGPNETDHEYPRHLGPMDDGLSIAVKNFSRYLDTFALKTSEMPFSFPMSVNAMYGWQSSLPNGTFYIPVAGRLGLGPGLERDTFVAPPPGPPDLLKPPGVLDQLKSAGRISSRFWGVHIGSVRLNQSASLTLGGYERNRVVGDVGVFQNDISGIYIEGRILLIDLFLGVEEGDSPFRGGHNITTQAPFSVWRGPLADHDSGTRAARKLGGPRGSAVVRVDPEVPYLYLPAGNCEVMSKILPICWRSDIQYWIWNTTDPGYARLLSSSGYLGFVFSDRRASNVTVKVPFALLDLTLTPPIVSEPTAYFPCVSKEPPSGVWALGRAFLQGAFFAMDYDAGLTYMAQAPGPSNKQQSVLQTADTSNPHILSGPADLYARTWRPHWTMALPKQENKQDNVESDGLSSGAIAGMSLGVVAAVAASGVCAAFFWRKSRQQRQMQELDSACVKALQEMPVPVMIHEVPVSGDWEAVELPGDVPAPAKSLGG